MYQRLFLGNKTLKLKEVNSTNSYLKELISANDKELEGLVVVAENQSSGRGQKGSLWESEDGKNLTFSILKIERSVIHQSVCILKEKSIDVLKITYGHHHPCIRKTISGTFFS